MPPDGEQWPNEGSPAGGGTPYGQELSGAPGAYGQRPYGHGGHGSTQPQSGLYQDPYGAVAPAYGMGGEPPKKSRAGLIIGVAVVAVIAVVGVFVAVVGASSGDDKLADGSPPSVSPSAVEAARAIKVPRTFGGYRRLTGGTADRTAQSMRKSMNEDGKDADLYAKAKIAIYAKTSDSTQELFFIGLSSSDNPAIAQELKSNSPSEEADSAFIGMGIGDPKDYPAGPLGGVLRCGVTTTQGITETACAWADSSTSGITVVANSRNTKALASTTLKLRTAAER